MRKLDSAQSLPSPERLTFGRRVYAERKRQGLTQEELADITDMNWSYLGGVERGTRNLRIDTMSRLALALKVPLVSLLTDEPQPFEPVLGPQQQKKRSRGRRKKSEAPD